MSLPSPATLAVAIALILDLAVGEPPNRAHPVAWFGRLVAPFDRKWTNPRAVGAAVAVALPLGAAGIVVGLVALAREQVDRHPGRDHVSGAGFARSSHRHSRRGVRAVNDRFQMPL